MNSKTSLNRRDFLKTASAATLGALAAGYSTPSNAAEVTEKPKPTADTVILLWMAGGMAHTETFDPKRYAPFEKGMASNRVLSTFPTIDTAVDPIKFSQGLEFLSFADIEALSNVNEGGQGGVVRPKRSRDERTDVRTRHGLGWRIAGMPVKLMP